jgi:hypothetical protein
MRSTHLFRLSTWFFLIARCSWSSIGQAAEKESDPIKTHLEFLGYVCDVVDQGLRARHQTKVSLVVSSARGGLLFQTGFPGKNGYKEEVHRLSMIQDLNKKAWLAHFYWTPEGNLFVEAWLPGLYEKSRFAQFHEAWDHDIQVLRDAYPGLKAYLAE